MNSFTITVLFALCISQYANSAAVSNTLTDVKKLREEVQTVLKVAKFYTENYLFEFAEAQENAKNDFQAQFDKELQAASTEIAAAAQKKGNSLKANKCVKEANAKLDSLKVSAPKDLENCVESQEAEEVDVLFDKLLDEISAARRIEKLVESLEKDVNDGRGANVESILPGVRSSVDLLEGEADELMEKGGQLMTNLENQFKVCIQKQLADNHSTVGQIKQEASQCISRA